MYNDDYDKNKSPYDYENIYTHRNDVDWGPLEDDDPDDDSSIPDWDDQDD